MLKKVVLLACLGAVCFTSEAVLASQDGSGYKEKACVQYQRADGSWGKNYSVRGYLVRGDQINRWFADRGEFTQYKDKKFYYFINWKRGNKTVIELGNKKVLPVSFELTKDQDDRVWMIRQGFCQH